MLIFPQQSRIVFAGDSVTDSGRDYSAIPGGWGFGNGYVNHIHNLLCATYPQLSLITINKGVSGDDIQLLSERWEEDIEKVHPDYISIMVGVNDVLPRFDWPYREKTKSDLEEFAAIYNNLLKKSRKDLPDLKGFIIMGPAIFEPWEQEPFRLKLSQYAHVCKQLARRYSALYVDTQTAIDTYLKRQHPYTASPDRIHPTERGAMIIARAWLKTVGYSWEGEVS